MPDGPLPFKRAVPVPESDIVRGCLELLKVRGIFAWRQNSGAVPVGKRFIRFTSINGVADILGILPDGRLLAVECKTKTGKVSPDQRYFQQMIAENNGVACVVRSVEELEADLKEAMDGADTSHRAALGVAS